MKNPFGDQELPGSYHNLKERMYKKISARTKSQISALLKNAYENALDEEKVILARDERKRLFFQIVEMIMEDITGKN